MKDTLNEYTFALITWTGEKEEIKIKLPSLRNLPTYLDMQRDETDLLEWLTGNVRKAPEEGEEPSEEPTWGEKFTDDSVYKVLEEVAELMDPRVEAWTTRQASKLEKIRAQKAKLGLSPSFGIGSPPKLPSPQVGNLTGSPT